MHIVGDTRYIILTKRILNETKTKPPNCGWTCFEIIQSKIPMSGYRYFFLVSNEDTLKKTTSVDISNTI